MKDKQLRPWLAALLCFVTAGSQAQNKSAEANQDLLGLPALNVPKDNPITKEKVVLGDRLFNDVRFSSTGKVSCATCHDPNKAFTDSPLKTSKGIHDLTGTRNAPTVINSAFYQTQFWDGRSPSLEDQSQHPIINPVEMGLKNHEPLLQIVRGEKSYQDMFKAAFGVAAHKISMKHVMMAMATFERTIIDGNSRFDRWYFKGEATLSEKEIAGFQTFVGNGRCVSCHAVEQTSALFTDNKFHAIGVGINRLPQAEVERLGHEFLQAQYDNKQVDEKVLSDAKVSELGRFAVTRNMSEMGAFKTSGLRNIDLTAPYMHDGSLKTLEDVVEHYNRGGASSDKEKSAITPYLSGGIRPLNLTNAEKSNLVAFMKALTSQKREKK
ncbi:MAG: cytochrome-c peroxidase [Bdellovibrionales bacterium]